MNVALRRTAVLLGVFLLAFLVVAGFRKLSGMGGLSNLLNFGAKDRESNYVPERYTLSSKPALSPGEVEYLAALDEEFARLTAAVVPSVVSLQTEGVKRNFMQDWLGR